SQYTQLIARRVRECRVRSEIVAPSITAAEIKQRAPKAIILSGGPDSVYREGAPQIAKGVLDLGLPTLGICYGMHLLAQELGGRVEQGNEREYGHADVEIDASCTLF